MGPTPAVPRVEWKDNGPATSAPFAMKSPGDV